MSQSEQEPTEPEVAELTFDDPHTWPLNEGLWNLVVGAETVDRILAVMRTAPVPASHPAYNAAVRFLSEAAQQARADLAAALVEHCGVPVPEEAASIFDTAGKARAFGEPLPPQPGSV